MGQQCLYVTVTKLVLLVIINTSQKIIQYNAIKDTHNNEVAIHDIDYNNIMLP